MLYEMGVKLFVYGILAVVALIFSLVFFLVAKISNKSTSEFELNKKHGKAEIVGYRREERSSWYTLLVKLLDVNDNSTYSCNGKKIKKSDYPVGSIIDVVYAKKKAFGINLFEVYLADYNVSNNKVITRAFKILSVIFFIIAVILILIILI